ncbi:hypothetical protein ACUXMM_002005 [Micrococcus aloeverae]
MTSLRIPATAALVAAVALTLTGCVGRESAGLGGSSTVAAPPTATAEKTWDASQWVPTERIEPLLTTEAEKERAYREQVARHAQGAGMPAPPQVERSGWYATSLESDRMVSTCLAEAGWPNSVGPTGGIQIDTPPESQRSAFEAAYVTCYAQHPVDPSYTQDWTDPQLRLVYDYWDQYLIPCLEAYGYTVDISARPSKEAFVSAFYTPGRHQWWPFADSMRGVSAERQAEVAQTCPELPPQDVFWGSSG